MLGIKDEMFIRGKIPMTKEEVRVLSISKLQLEKDSVVYDIGAGTGSVSIEIALQDPGISVYSIETNSEAIALIERNKEKFGASNIQIVEALAPDKLDTLPMPSHVFIGGSKGRLQSILDCIYERNKNCRVVINALTLESIAQIKDVLTSYSICEEDLVQVQISKMKKVGTYHMMSANNPVYIFSFSFMEKEYE